jgi:hypothetical protein
MMNTKSKVVVGTILVISGAASLIGNLGFLNENFVLPVLGAAFLIAYFVLGGNKRYRNLGFLIPGIILPGLQLLKLAEDNKVGEQTEVIMVFGILSTCFLLVFLIHTFWFKEVSRGQRNWPLYVSIALILFGGAAYAAEYYNWGFGMVILGNIWPAVLVVVGLRLLYKASKANKENING